MDPFSEDQSAVVTDCTQKAQFASSQPHLKVVFGGILLCSQGIMGILSLWFWVLPGVSLASSS